MSLSTLLHQQFKTMPIEQTEFFMCKVDYDYHLEGDAHGARVYADIESLRQTRKCVAQCGIVKVKLELVEVVQDTDYSSLKPAY